MLAAAPSRYGVDHGAALYGATNSMLRDVDTVTRSGQFYVTPELSRELAGLQRGAQHIRLDQQFMRSPHWSKKFDNDRSQLERQAALSAVHKANSAVQNVQSQLHSDNLQERQENQIRQTHHTAVHTLRGAQEDLSPFADGSADRIRQFCDHIGVTDRYTGYRQNLNRGSRQPLRLGFNWMDKSQQLNSSRPITAHQRSQTVRFADSRQLAKSAPPTGRMTLNQDTLDPNVNVTNKPVRNVPMSIQEQCGINTTFPGKTEYMIRYVSPPGDSLSRGYIVNPTPDFLIHGRPLAKTMFEACNTEYQTRYEWPDSNKITKLPWLRK